MKPKFANQITEKERRGSSDRGGDAKGVDVYARGQHSTHSVDPEPGEEFVSKRRLSMRRGTKSFSDFLTPLRSFLQTSVGRKWDDVYSEISQGIPSNSMQGRHIRQHVEGYVEKNVIMIDGVPHRVPRYGAGPTPLVGRGQDSFYVDPGTDKLELVVARYGMFRDTAGRQMYLETWVEQHFGKSPQKIEDILMTGKDAYGKPPRQEDIYKAMNKVGVVDGRGLLRARPSGEVSAKEAWVRRAEKQLAVDKERAAEEALKKSNQKRKAKKRQQDIE